MIKMENVRLHERENKLLLELARGCLCSGVRLKSMMSEELDEGYLLGQICMHNMAPIAYWTLKKALLLHCFDSEFVSTLRMSYEHAQMVGMDCLNSLSGLAPLFRKFDLPYAFTKEAMLAQIYPHGLRIFDPYEMLVSGDDLRKTVAFLESCGFQRSCEKEGCVCLVRPADGVVVKHTKIVINAALSAEPEKDRKAVAEMLARAERSVHTWQGSLYSLEPVDAAISLCANLYRKTELYREQENRLFPNLYLLGELLAWSSCFMNRESEAAFTDRVQRYGLQKQCQYAFLALEELFGVQRS